MSRQFCLSISTKAYRFSLLLPACSFFFSPSISVSSSESTNTYRPLLSLSLTKQCDLVLIKKSTCFIQSMYIFLSLSHTLPLPFETSKVHCQHPAWISRRVSTQTCDEESRSTSRNLVRIDRLRSVFNCQRSSSAV